MGFVKDVSDKSLRTLVTLPPGSQVQGNPRQIAVTN